MSQWQKNERNTRINTPPAPPEITVTLSFVGENQAAPAILKFYKTSYTDEDFSPIAKGGRSMYDDLMQELSDFPLRVPCKIRRDEFWKRIE